MQCPRGTRVQSLLIPRSKYPRPSSALAWARQHGFKASKVDAAMAGSGRKFHRVRQAPPSSFSSFRVITFGKSGVKAVVGCPRSAK